MHFLVSPIKLVKALLVNLQSHCKIMHLCLCPQSLHDHSLIYNPKQKFRGQVGHLTKMASGPKRRHSKQLPPNLSELMDKLTEEAALFIQQFSTSEPRMREIVEEFLRISNKIKDMQWKMDTVRTVGSPDCDLDCMKDSCSLSLSFLMTSVSRLDVVVYPCKAGPQPLHWSANIYLTVFTPHLTWIKRFSLIFFCSHWKSCVLVSSLIKSLQRQTHETWQSIFFSVQFNHRLNKIKQNKLSAKFCTLYF